MIKHICSFVILIYVKHKDKGNILGFPSAALRKNWYDMLLKIILTASPLMFMISEIKNITKCLQGVSEF